MPRHRTAKLVALVVLAGLGVGLAVAAATESLPPQASDTARSAVTTAGPPTTPAGPLTTTPTTPTDAQNESNGVGPDANGPAKFGLCKAYFSGQGGTNGAKNDSVAFQALATAAGGAQNIEKFCADATPAGKPRPSGAPSGTPGKPDVVGGPHGNPNANPASADHGPQSSNAQNGLGHKP